MLPECGAVVVFSTRGSQSGTLSSVSVFDGPRVCNCRKFQPGFQTRPVRPRSRPDQSRSSQVQSSPIQVQSGPGPVQSRSSQVQVQSSPGPVRSSPGPVRSRSSPAPVQSSPGRSPRMLKYVAAASTECRDVCQGNDKNRKKLASTQPVASLFFEKTAGAKNNSFSFRSGRKLFSKCVTMFVFLGIIYGPSGELIIVLGVCV